MFRPAILLLVGLIARSQALSQHQRPSRRTFLVQLPTTAAALATSGAFGLHQDGKCSCRICMGVPAAEAYERRDVGGPGRSADTAALNDQAYQTQNRLEREGFKLETEQEQIASLSAALSDYSYSPSTGDKKKSNNKAKPGKREK